MARLRKPPQCVRRARPEHLAGPCTEARGSVPGRDGPRLVTRVHGAEDRRVRGRERSGGAEGRSGGAEGRWRGRERDDSSQERRAAHPGVRCSPDGVQTCKQPSGWREKCLALYRNGHAEGAEYAVT